MMVARAHTEPVQLAAVSSSSQRVDALSTIPSCLGIGGHTSGSRQGHPRYTGARSAGRPWVAQSTVQHSKQCRNTPNSQAFLVPKILILLNPVFRSDFFTKFWFRFFLKLFSLPFPPSLLPPSSTYPHTPRTTHHFHPHAHNVVSAQVL